MGNCFKRCVGEDSDSDQGHVSYPNRNSSYGDRPHPPSSFTYKVVGFTAVARDLLDFEATHKVPVALKEYVSASKATQILWYEKLLGAWKRAKPAPATAEEVAVLLVQTLQAHNFHNFQGLLEFYHLPWPKAPKAPGKPAPEVRVPEPDVAFPEPDVAFPEAEVAWPEDVEYEIHTLPVHEGAAGDGDGLTVYVDVFEDAREKGNLPLEILDAAARRKEARAKRDYETADALQRQIQKANYKVFDAKSGGIQCLARKYRIRLKGVDAPEIEQPYGKESKDKLNDLVSGHRLLIHVYERDQFGRELGDVHGNGVFIQEALLKEGCVWHFKKHDKRTHFAKWERDARAARRGLWADDFPEKPWDYRRRNNYGGRSARKRGG